MKRGRESKMSGQSTPGSGTSSVIENRPPFKVGKVGSDGQKRRTLSNTPMKNNSYFPRGSESSGSSPDGRKSDRFIKPLPGGKIIAGSRAIPIEEYLKSRSNRGLRVSSDPN